MNFTESQRKRYLMAIALLILAIVLACAWSLWRTRPRAEVTPETTAAPEPALTAAPTRQPDEAASAGVEPAQEVKTAGKVSAWDAWLE